MGIPQLNIKTAGMAAIGAAMLAGFVACDNIDKDERLIYMEPVDVSRAVLIEDFTGQLCPNCPKAADVISQLHEQYGDAIIAVAIHSGRLALNDSPAAVGLKTDLGDAYYNYWNVPYQPIGMVNRSGNLTDYTNWIVDVETELAKKPEVLLNVTTEYDAASRKVDVNTEIIGLSDNVAGKLQLWIVEDDITALQTMPDGAVNMNYVHNHVLRDAINGQWGEDMTVTRNQSATIESAYTIPEKWDVDNLHIVAFVYNSAGVLQATRVPVLPDTAEPEPETPSEPE